MRTNFFVCLFVCIVTYEVVYRQIKFFYRHLQLFYMHLSSKLFQLNPKAFTYCMGPAHKLCEQKNTYHWTWERVQDSDPWFLPKHYIHQIPKDDRWWEQTCFAGDQGCFVGAPSWRPQPSSDWEAIHPLGWCTANKPLPRSCLFGQSAVLSRG